MSEPRTSLTHPIIVGWLPFPGPGKIGLTFAPGKKQAAAQTGAWDRDLATDLARLRDEYGARHLVSLVEDAELAELGIADLAEVTAVAGIRVHRFPVPDFGLPANGAAYAALVSEAVGWAAAGENVVVHCKGGLGRAGAFGGCLLRASGMGTDEALAALVAARGPSCPETEAQRAYIRNFEAAPASRRSRVLGAVLGAAIGDAMGHPTEFIRSWAALRAKYGADGVQGFEKWWTSDDGGRFAPYTDDTQMAEIVLRGLVSNGAAGLEATMSEIGRGFVDWSMNPQSGHRAPGNACMAGARNIAGGAHWSEGGAPGAGGCGSVMRAYPFGIVFRGDAERAEEWAAQHSKLTHRAPLALAACAAMAVGVARTLSGEPTETVLSEMIAAAGRWDAGTAGMIQRAVDEARAGVEPEVTLSRLEGWAAHEAIAAAAYIVARHPGDARAAILEGANTPGDSDSIATLAGALVGARVGLEGLPSDWVRDVERSSELLTLAKEAADAA